MEIERKMRDRVCPASGGRVAGGMREADLGFQLILYYYILPPSAGNLTQPGSPFSGRGRPYSERFAHPAGPV